MSEFFINLALGFATWVVGLFPDWDVPSELSGFATTVNNFVAGFGGLGAWAPWALVMICAGIAIAAWVVGLGVKGLRAVAAHVPFVGGAG